jgi:hypothetical protein
MASGITLEIAITHRDAWLAAELALATAQEYTISNGATVRKLVRADLAEVRKQVEYWEGKVRNLTPGSRRVRYGVPLG